MKVFHKIILLLSIITLLILGLYYDSFYVAPKRYTVRFETISSNKIPKQLNNLSVLFFSDIHFGEFMNIQRLKELVNKINSLDVDVIIFGGDLFESDKLSSIDENTINEVTNLLKSLKSNLGKFAVYGDLDHNNLDLVNNVLFNSDFEVLNNRNIKLRNKSTQSINIIGIDSEDNGEIDINNAYFNISKGSFSITACHTPDTVLKIPTDISDLYLTGHTLGGQVNYIFDSLYKPSFSQYYFSGKHKLNNKVLIDITSGIGTVKKDVRFLSNAEVVVYRLKSIETKDIIENN